MYTKESVVVGKCIICDKNICNLGYDSCDPKYAEKAYQSYIIAYKKGQTPLRACVCDNCINEQRQKNTLNLTEDNLFITIPRIAIALQYNGPEDINKIIDTLEKIWYKHSEYQVAYSPIGNVISINTPNKHLKIHLGEILVLYNTYDSLEVLTETKFKQKFMCKSQH